MNIKRARELIGEENKKYDDEQLQKLIDDVSFLAQAAVNKIKKMTKEELKQFVDKNENGKK